MLPKYLDIVGIKCPVKVKELDDDEDGCFITVKNKIYINKETKKEDYIELTIHEGIHGIIDISGLGDDMPIEIEHVLITNILRFLKANYKIKFK